MELLEIFSSTPGAKTWYGKLIMLALLVVLLSISAFVLYLKFK